MRTDLKPVQAMKPCCTPSRTTEAAPLRYEPYSPSWRRQDSSHDILDIPRGRALLETDSPFIGTVRQNELETGRAVS